MYSNLRILHYVINITLEPSMQKILFALLALCLFQTAFSACADGTYTNPAPTDSAKGLCIVCSPVCNTCNSTGCITYLSKFKGLNTSSTPIVPYCLQSIGVGSLIGYNSKTDTCDQCIDGCSGCIFDYDVCTSCKAGWDFDRAGLQCLRATLGLAAVVLALSALLLVVVVITCICACKLWLFEAKILFILVSIILFFFFSVYIFCLEKILKFKIYPK